MTRTDAAYQMTRRSSIGVTVNRTTDTTSNPLTGTKTPTIVSTVVQNAVIEPTKYTKLLRAEATGQRIGTTTVIMWTGDLDFTELTDQDEIVITSNGKKLQVIGSSVEDTTFIVTVQEFSK